MKINIINFFEDTSEKTPIFHMLNTNMKNQVEYFRYETDAVTCEAGDLTLYIFEEPNEEIACFLENEYCEHQPFIQISANPISRYPFILCDAWFARDINYEDLVHILMLILECEPFDLGHCRKELLLGRMRQDWDHERVIKAMLRQSPEVDSARLYRISKDKVKQDCYENLGTICGVEVVQIILKGKSEYTHCGLLFDID